MPKQLLKIVPSIKCEKSGCNRTHLLDAESYFSVYGNIHVGNKGGIIGNNFGDNFELKNVMTFCKGCLVRILQEQI